MLCVAAGVALTALLPVQTAHAHPTIDAARARFDDADFAAVLELLASAEQRSDLSTSDLETLFELRAIAGIANGDPTTMERALTSLVAIAPEHRLGSEAPPEVIEAFERARSRTPARLRIAVAGERRGDRVSIRARTENDPTSLVRELRLSVRVDASPWRPAANAAITLTAEPSQSIEYHAEAIGPGGATIASDGTPEQPARVSAVDLSSSDRVPQGGDHGGGVSPWLWVAIGAVAVGVGVTIAVVATRPESDITRPLLPTITFD